MIRFEHICKSYKGARVVDDLNLHIARGELLVLIGASGSGKSTILKMINRLEPHDSGRILFDGREIQSFKPRDLRLRMGYAIQSVGLFPHWTVARNIATVPNLLGWPAAKIGKRVDALLTLFELAPAQYRTRLPHQLSGGQQQRVGVARALAADPDVLLMDEPFGALDPVTRAALQQALKRIHRQSGKTIVLVTHDIDEALLLATRVVLIDQGRVVQQATPLDLLSRPANATVEEFVGRSDIGIKWLSLQSAVDRARAQPTSPGLTLAAQASLREAVSIMALHHVDRINVLDTSGQHAGVLYAADVFAPQGTPGG
ncbi:MAG: ATP-binding protein [Comamonadaceae bacterium CG_4_9_14_3_um_filter_60_33]|nr:MAG: ATP-binding protein [Comamonadaceae bacterium CG2_30_59_20]PIY27895.1 MAG: ATP-binding protein [Comamonadaceae bacterium CG_4_10_14_3_um_filter_60_42]PJB43821.1 MAG: ATP-binding protein [Comamonadaceae bacterium CG_4_9_14_3_um_filter_60_33]